MISTNPADYITRPVLDMFLEKVSEATRKLLNERLTCEIISTQKGFASLTDSVLKDVVEIYRSSLSRKSVDATDFEEPDVFEEYLQELRDPELHYCDPDLLEVLVVCKFDKKAVAFISGVFERKQRVFAVWYMMAHRNLNDEKSEKILSREDQQGTSIASKFLVSKLMDFVTKELKAACLTFEATYDDTQPSLARLIIFSKIERSLRAVSASYRLAHPWSRRECYVCHFPYYCPDFSEPGEPSKSRRLHLGVIPIDRELCEEFASGEVTKPAMRRIVTGLYEGYYLIYPAEDEVGKKARKSAEKLLRKFDRQGGQEAIRVERLSSYVVVAEQRRRAPRLPYQPPSERTQP